MANAIKSRPLSPHLQIYRFKPTMLMSIIHRITGGALYFGTVLVAWWLVAVAVGGTTFEWANAIFGSIIGQLVLFGYTWALVHHMLGGMRYLVWDTGHGLEKDTATRIVNATLVVSIALTVLIWIVGYLVR